jgi:hypothetical protein
MSRALKGHKIWKQSVASRIGSLTRPETRSFWRHFQGASIWNRHPGLKPWAKILGRFAVILLVLFISFFAFFAIFRSYSLLYLQPFGVKYAGLVRSFVSMRAEVVPLGLQKIGR